MSLSICEALDQDSLLSVFSFFLDDLDSFISLGSTCKYFSQLSRSSFLQIAIIDQASASLGNKVEVSEGTLKSFSFCLKDQACLKSLSSFDNDSILKLLEASSRFRGESLFSLQFCLSEMILNRFETMSQGTKKRSTSILCKLGLAPDMRSSNVLDTLTLVMALVACFRSPSWGALVMRKLGAQVLMNFAHPWYMTLMIMLFALEIALRHLFRQH